MAYKEGQLLGFAKNGSPIYMAASDNEPKMDFGIFAGSLLVVGLIGVFAMAGVMAGESRKRKKVAPRWH